jgi:dehydrogenase/reductase SDR family protein 4
MNRDLEDKVAVVTGASCGIGRSIAFANSGARLVLASRNKYRELDKVAQEIRETGASYLIVPTHLGKVAELDKLVIEAQGKFGRIDILVNNAATNPVIAPLIQTKERTWDHIMNVNLKACFLLS